MELLLYKQECGIKIANCSVNTASTICLHPASNWSIILVERKHFCKRNKTGYVEDGKQSQ